MSNPTPSTIQEAAQFWAAKLGDSVTGPDDPFRVVFTLGPYDEWRLWDDYLSDHRTAARAFRHAFHLLRVRKLDEPMHLGERRMRRLWQLWEKAMLNPTAALIELARVVREVEGAA